MRETTAPRLPHLPFFVGDALLLGTAALIGWQAPEPWSVRVMVLVACCVAGAALFGIAPFLLEYRSLVKLSAVDALDSAIGSIRQLETVGAQITSATNLWNNVHEQAEKTSGTAKSIAEHMTRELKEFTAFMERANDNEKSTLRLEVDKLRRAEAEYVQVVVRMLDHVFALHQGAQRSGQQNVAQQVGRFQLACCDAARRVGLAPFTPGENEPFNPERHKPLDSKTKPPSDAVVSETVATGYTYQGRILRPALVKLRGNGSPDQAQTDSQEQLPLPTEPTNDAVGNGPD
jgi:molecular chaperone GrpE (heat shock protein)